MTVPLYNLTDTWNNGSTIFTAIKMNVTDTASDATSLLLDLQIAGVSQFNVGKTYNQIKNQIWFGANVGYSVGGATGVLNYSANGAIDWISQLIAVGNNAFFPGIVLAKTRGADTLTITAVQDGDELGVFDFYGADTGAIYREAAVIRVKVNGTPGSNDMPGRIEFSATPAGSGSALERLRIDSPTTATQTAMMLYDVDNNTLERVTVGIADSGGAGFKVLRIPN